MANFFQKKLKFSCLQILDKLEWIVEGLDEILVDASLSIDRLQVFVQVLRGEQTGGYIVKQSLTDNLSNQIKTRLNITI